MRTISGTLTTVIGANTRRPAITLTAEDHIMHLGNSISTSSNVPGLLDGWSDMCVANDGSIVRVRVTWGGGGSDFIQNFQWQRITDPTSSSQWTTWTTFSGASGNMWDDGSCCISNNSGTLRAFAQQGTGGSAIWVWISTNNGVSWTGPVTILTLPGSASIKGIGSAGNNDVFFVYDTFGGEQLGASFISGGAWSALVTSSFTPFNPYADGLGIAVVYVSGIYHLIYTDGYTVYHATYNPTGPTWASVNIIAPATSQAIKRLSPRLSLMDGVYNLVYVELDNGFYTSTIYNYPRIRQSSDLTNWSAGTILPDMPAQDGCNIVKCQAPSASRQQYICSTMAKIEYSNAHLQSDTTQYIDLSSYVLEYKREEELGKPAHITVLLDNTNGALNNYVTSYGSGNYKPIGLNTTLSLSEGYYTGTPPTTKEVVTVAKYRIKQIGFDRAPGKSELQIYAQDITNYFDIESRYQYDYTNFSVQVTLQSIVALSGVLNYNVPSISQLTVSVLTYSIHAGRKYRQSIDELSRVGWVEYFLDQTETLQVKELSNSDPSVWTYQPEIETLVLGSDDERNNHIIVNGKPPAGPTIPIGSVTSAELYDMTHLHQIGMERSNVYVDVKLFTQVLCANKATFLLQQEQRDQVAHTITVPANPALQLCDVITVTDQGSSVSGTGQTVNSRIYKQEVTFLAEKAEFLHTIYLEGV